VIHGLRSVTGLEAGRTQARETKAVEPVAQAHVDATLPFLNRQLAAMVRIQLYSGARPGEVCIMRAADLDMSGKVWLYRPARHKTQHRGKPRVVAIGPKAQAVIRQFLSLDLQAYLFSPAHAEEERYATAEAERTTPRSCGNRRGTNRKKKRRKQPGERYTTSSYQKAVAKGIKKADAASRKAAIEQALEAGQELPADDVVFVPHWHVHQLRHTTATDVRRLFGLESAQCVLGHSEANVTEIYAERDLALAVRVAAEIG
jgi:integrase